MDNSEVYITIKFKRMIQPGKYISRWPLHCWKYTYETSKSTETALHELAAKIKKAMLHSWMLKVYSSTYAPFTGICHAPKQHGIDPLPISWIRHMASHFVTWLAKWSFRNFINFEASRSPYIPCRSLLYLIRHRFLQKNLGVTQLDESLPGLFSTLPFQRRLGIFQSQSSNLI